MSRETLPAAGAVERSRGSYVGYILGGYPRIDDAFITNEIYLLESMGVNLHIFSIKKPPTMRRHAL